MELDLRGVPVGPVAQARARHPGHLLRPGDRRRRDLRLRRIAAHQRGGRGHQLADGAFEVDPALDVVLADLADLPGREVGERRQLLQPKRDARVLAADPAPAGKDDGERKTQGTEALLESDGDR